MPPLLIRLQRAAPLLARELGAGALVGSSFGFLGAGVPGSEAVRAIAGPLGLEAVGRWPRAVALWAQEAGQEVALPGAAARARVLPRWRPCGLWTDQRVYGRAQPVQLVVTCPGVEDASIEVSLGQRGQQGRRVEVPLHGGGLGHVELRGLGVGVWRVSARVPGGGGEQVSLRFAVQGEAASLVGRWLAREFEGEGGAEVLRFAVGLEAHGCPLAGRVEVGLLDLSHGNRSRVDGVAADPFGVVRGNVPMKGQGPRALYFASEALGMETRLIIPEERRRGERLGFGSPRSGVELVPARADEGDSALGLRLVDSAEQGASDLDEGSAAEAVWVDPRPSEHALSITARRRAWALSAISLEPLSGRVRVYEIGDVEAGQGRRLPAVDPIGVVALGGIVEGEGGALVPWESWGGWLARPGASAVSLSWRGVERRDGETALIDVEGDPEGRGGARPWVVIRAGSPEEKVPVLLIARRSEGAARRADRAPVGVTEPLGVGLLGDVARLCGALGEGELRALFEAAGGQAGLEGIGARLRLSEAQDTGGWFGVGVEGAGEVSGGPVVEAMPVEGEQGEPLMVQVVRVGGEAAVALPAVTRGGIVTVEAIAASRPHWSMARLRARAGGFARVSWWLPPFVDRGDEVWSRLEVWTLSGAARLSVSVDGEAVAVTRQARWPGEAGEVIGPGGRLPEEAFMVFPVRPGRWEVRLEGPEGEAPIVRVGVVSEAGRRRHPVEVFRALTPKRGRLVADEVGALGGLWPVESLASTFEGLIGATLGASWDGCESLAAGVVAAAAGILRGVGSRDGGRVARAAARAGGAPGSAPVDAVNDSVSAPLDAVVDGDERVDDVSSSVSSGDDRVDGVDHVEAVVDGVDRADEGVRGGASALEGLLLERAARLEARFVAGRGFARDRVGGVVDPQQSDLTVRHILRLEALVEADGRGAALGQEARAALGRLGRLARRAAIAGDVVMPPPPDQLRSADDADLLVSLRADRLAVAAATARARLKRQVSGLDSEIDPTRRGSDFARGAVLRRCDRAYGARTLLRTGDPIDRVAALEALGAALSGGPRGFLGGVAFNTVDAAALIFALADLLKEPPRGARASISRGDSAGASSVEVTQGCVWVRWQVEAIDDLTDPAGAAAPLDVSLRRPGARSPEVRFVFGELIELCVDLGAPGAGGGAASGDRLEIHLPAALEPVDLPASAFAPAGGCGVEGRRLQLDLNGRHRVELLLRAVALTSHDPDRPSAQHLAVGLSNRLDAGRGRGKVGLDVIIGVGGEGLGGRLKRGVRQFLK